PSLRRAIDVSRAVSWYSTVCCSTPGCPPRPTLFPYTTLFRSYYVLWEVVMTEKEVTKNKGLVQDAAADDSLGDINGSVSVPKGGSFWRKLWAFSGPGALVAVGYMDPGNWVTSVTGGATYHYTLLSVVLISSLIAMMLQ